MVINDYCYFIPLKPKGMRNVSRACIERSALVAPVKTKLAAFASAIGCSCEWTHSNVMICCPRTMGSRRRKAVALLVIIYVIASCGLLHFLLQMGKLRANEEEKTFGEDLYRNQRQEPAVTLNVSRLVSVASANTSHWASLLNSTSVSRIVPASSANTSRWASLLNSTSEETKEQDPRVLPKLQAPLSGRGYVVALGFWEQVLAATRNLLQMQCWASTLGSGVSVVQPLLLSNSSGLGLSFASDRTDVSRLGLDTLFNMTTWSQQWTGASPLAPLVSREDLISEISKFKKSVVLVELKYLPHRDAKCKFTWDVVHVMEGLKQYQNLNVARNVCINAQKAMSPSKFRSLVFGDLAPQDSLLIFQEWRGLSMMRVNIQIPSCTKQADRHHLHLSDQVWKDAKNYVNTHLGGIGQFISTSARFEKMDIKYGSWTLEHRQRQIKTLIPQALSDVRELQRKHSVKKVYLTYDYGKFGSRSFKDRHYYNLEDMLIKFQTDLYNGTVSFAEYEESLRALSYTHPAYVALVQMAVSSMGKCLVQIGWGHVISLTKELFMRTHQNPYCIKCLSAGGCQHIG